MAQTTVFAFKFKKDIWSPSRARTWLKKHGHRVSELHEDDGTFSLVQRPRSDFGPQLTQKAHSPSHPGVFEVRGVLKSDQGKQAKSKAPRKKTARKKVAPKAATKPKKAAKKRTKSTTAGHKKVVRKKTAKGKKVGKKAARKAPAKPKKVGKKRTARTGKKKAGKRAALPTFKPGELVGVLEKRGGKVTHWAHVVSVAGRMVVIRSDGTQRAVKATHLLPVPKKAEVK